MHPVTVIAVGVALEEVALPTTVFAACAARFVRPTFPVAVKVPVAANAPLTVALLSDAVPWLVMLLYVGLG
ncbi:hypothetical protein C6V05_22710 [Burkholderia multivorans]|nr:hypothetical protein C6V05_22710 [Burkholderia multivorans]